jgi:hypothetical protein
VRTAVLRRSPALFAVSAFAIVTACLVIARSAAFRANPDVAAWGITFDLTISIPLVYWFLMVRTGRTRPLTVAPVFILGTVAATLLLPRGQQQFVHSLRTFLVPAAELVLIGALIARVRALNALPRANDPYTRIRTAAGALAGEGRVADVIASEAAMIYYALFCWRKRPEDVDGRAITFHERAGWSTIVVCLMVLLAAESFGMHLLLRLWHPLAAWIWTGCDLWAAAWLVGDYHALRLRRTVLDADALHLRYGMRWSATIPLANIASIEPITSEPQWKRPGVLKVAILEEPRWLVTLHEPVVVQGLAGIRKTITALALLPDDDDALTMLRAACSSLQR